MVYKVEFCIHSDYINIEEEIADYVRIKFNTLPLPYGAAKFIKVFNNKPKEKESPWPAKEE